MVYTIKDARTELAPIITKELLEDKDTPLVLNSIAGCAKSSCTFGILTNLNISFGWFIATNLLKFSAITKYSDKNPSVKFSTIASGLFTNKGTHYYIDYKEPDVDVIVIDEILLSSPRVFDFINDNLGSYKFIILTDDRQMLGASESDAFRMKYKLHELMERSDVITITETLRARDTKTNELYHKFYDIADSEQMFYTPFLKENFRTIDFEDMPYDKTAVYACHKNTLDLLMYKKFEFNNMPDIDRIPKGQFASRPPKNLENYPLLPQIEAEKKGAPKSYCQVGNIGSVTRLQGSEAENTLYYLVTESSVITARELYTLITRLWYIDNLVVVICDESQLAEKPKTFMGIPVKKMEYLHIDYDDNTKVCSRQEMKEIFEDYPDTDDVYYNKEVIYRKDYTNCIAYLASGHRPSKSYAMIKGTPKSLFGQQRQRTIMSLAKRTGVLAHTYTPQIYTILEKYGYDHISAPRIHGKRPKCKYNIDFTSAYPQIMYFCKMPAEGMLSTTRSDDMINYYLYEGSKFTNGSVVDEDLANDIMAHPDWGKVTYIFSTPFSQGLYIGEELYFKSFKSIEDKAEVKDILRGSGLFEHHYLTRKEDGTDGPCYVINEYNHYELFFATVYSQLTHLMIKLSDALNANGIKVKKIQVDAVKFDDLDIDKCVKIATETLPEWAKWKIEELSNVHGVPNKMICMNYDPLPSRDDVERNNNNEAAKKYRAKKKAEMTEEEKAEKRRKDAERKRKSREAKKLAKES